MALRFYDPGGPNLLNGSSCSSTCLWNCFPWDVMPVNVTVLAGLTSSRSRKDLPLARGQTSEEMTRLCPASASSCLPSSTVSRCLCPLPQSLILWLFRCLSPPASLSHTLLYLLTHSALLCPCCHGYYRLRMRWGGLMEDTGAYDTPAIHHCPSFSTLKSLSLSSLQLTAARGK